MVSVVAADVLRSLEVELVLLLLSTSRWWWMDGSCQDVFSVGAVVISVHPCPTEGKQPSSECSRRAGVVRECVRAAAAAEALVGNRNLTRLLAFF